MQIYGFFKSYPDRFVNSHDDCSWKIAILNRGIHLEIVGCLIVILSFRGYHRTWLSAGVAKGCPPSLVSSDRMLSLRSPTRKVKKIIVVTITGEEVDCV